MATALSAAFSGRELNGDSLWEALEALEADGMRPDRLAACARALEGLGKSSPADAAAFLRQLAEGRFSPDRAVARLLLKWAGLLRASGDSAALEDHVRRLAQVALLRAVR